MISEAFHRYLALSPDEVEEHFQSLVNSNKKSDEIQTQHQLPDPSSNNQLPKVNALTAKLRPASPRPPAHQVPAVPTTNSTNSV